MIIEAYSTVRSPLPHWQRPRHRQLGLWHLSRTLSRPEPLQAGHCGRLRCGGDLRRGGGVGLRHRRPGIVDWARLPDGPGVLARGGRVPDRRAGGAGGERRLLRLASGEADGERRLLSLVGNGPDGDLYRAIGCSRPPSDESSSSDERRSRLLGLNPD